MIIESKNSQIDEDTTRLYFKQILDAIDYCHKKDYAHRDIKLENILFDKDKKNAKIIDFGFAALLKDKYGDRVINDHLGTLLYMAPELHLRQPYDSKAVDIFALGVVLFTMIAGHQPFHHT